MQLDERFKQVKNTILLLHKLPTPSNTYRMILQDQVLQELTKVNVINDCLACNFEKRKWIDKNKSLQGKDQGKTSKGPPGFVIIVKFMATILISAGKYMAIQQKSNPIHERKNIKVVQMLPPTQKNKRLKKCILRGLCWRW